jgi:hypothetical protein
MASQVIQPNEHLVPDDDNKEVDDVDVVDDALKKAKEAEEAKEAARKARIDQCLKAFESFDQNFADAYAFLDKYELRDEFNTIIDNPISCTKDIFNDLFLFAIQNGMMSLVQFLYQECNVTYETALHDSAFKTFETTFVNKNDNMQAQETRLSEKTSMTVHIEGGRFAGARTRCIQYLIRMRPYSLYTSRKGKYRYRFVPKYREKFYGAIN